MCRLMAYMGTPIIANELLYQPKNSLIKQSINAKELEEPLNGDGFGIGWYTPEISDEPVTFVSVNPAWNNRNLRNLAPKIKTSCMVAHVRAASVGDVSESNCHPFQYKSLLMLHNGGVEHFSRIKRKLREPLQDSLYNWIRGQTDSEHIFAYLVDYMERTQRPVDQFLVMEAFEATFGRLKSLMKEQHIQEPGYFNMVVTNGSFVVGTRYVTDDQEEALTLYHSGRRKYFCEDGVCHMVDDNDNASVLVVSEKLTDQTSDWAEIPRNHFVLVDSQLDVSTHPIQVRV